MVIFCENTERTLIAMARELYPFDFLDDTHYAVVIERIAAQGDPERIELLAEGVANLNALADVPFINQSEDQKLASLKAIEGTAFFNDIRQTTVRELFSNPAVWPFFGYEGPSGHRGGYIKRGLSDADWIPDD
jgi:hypothetical protein